MVQFNLVRGQFPKVYLFGITVVLNIAPRVGWEAGSVIRIRVCDEQGVSGDSVKWLVLPSGRLGNLVVYLKASQQTSMSSPTKDRRPFPLPQLSLEPGHV